MINLASKVENTKSFANETAEKVAEVYDEALALYAEVHGFQMPTIHIESIKGDAEMAEQEVSRLSARMDAILCIGNQRCSGVMLVAYDSLRRRSLMRPINCFQTKQMQANAEDQLKNKQTLLTSLNQQKEQINALLERGSEQHDVAAEILMEVDAAHVAAKQALESATKTLAEAKQTYKTLTGCCFFLRNKAELCYRNHR